MKYSFVLFIILTINCYPQNLIETYKDYIPDIYFQNQNYLQPLNTALETYSNIHPDLIYYYLKNIEVRFDTTISDRYFYENFLEIKNLYSYHYNDWITILEQNIISLNLDSRLTNICIDFLDDYIDDEIEIIDLPDLENKTDFNLLNFLVIKYYTENRSLIYDNRISYKNEREKLDEEKLSVFSDMMNDPSVYNISDLNNLFKYWYLFDDYTGIAKTVADVLDHYYNNENLFSRMEVGINYSVKNNYLKRTGDDYNTTLYNPTNKTNFYLHSLAISFKYKIYLTKYLQYLNLVNFKLSAGFGIINKSTTCEEIGYDYNNVEGISNRWAIFGFNQNDLKLKNSEYLTAEISIPVFYFGENISFDLGFGLTLLNTNYELTYDYYYRKFDQGFINPTILESAYDNVSNKKLSSIETIFHPELSVKFYLDRPYSLNLILSNYMLAIEMNMNL